MSQKYEWALILTYARLWSLSLTFSHKVSDKSRYGHQVSDNGTWCDRLMFDREATFVTQCVSNSAERKNITQRVMDLHGLARMDVF